MRMALFSAMAVAVLVEEEKTKDVRGQAQAADDKDQHGFGHDLRFDESLNGFEEDGQTEGDQEHSIDQCT